MDSKAANKKKQKEKSTRRKRRDDVPELDIMALVAEDNRKVNSFTDLHNAEFKDIPSPAPRPIKSSRGLPDSTPIFDECEGKTPVEIRRIQIRKKQRAFEAKIKITMDNLKIQEELLSRLQEEKDKDKDKRKKQKRREDEASPEEILASMNFERFQPLRELKDSDTPEEIRQRQVECENTLFNRIKDEEISTVLRKFLLGTSERKNMYMMKNRDISAILWKIWDLFEKNFYGCVDDLGIREFIQSCFTLLVPTLHGNAIIEASNWFLDSLEPKDKQNYTQIEFFDLMLHLSDIFLERADIQSYTVFFKFLLNRLSVYRETDSLTGEESVLPTQTSIKFYETSAVNAKLSSELNFKDQPSNVLYVCETIRTEIDSVNSTRSLSVSLLKPREVTPIGSTTDELAWNLQNQISDSKAFKGLDVVGKQEIYPFLKKERFLFYIGFLIEDEDSNYIRLNPCLFRPMYFEKFATKDGKSEFFNMLTYKTETLNRIDRVQKLKSQWNESKKEAPVPEAHEIAGKPPRATISVLIKGRQRLCGVVQDHEALSDVNYKTSDSFGQIKSESFDRITTRELELPKDPEDPYSDDVQKYARERSFNIIVHGKPKIGKTTFCKELAKELDLEFLDPELLIKGLLIRVAEGEENVETDDDGNPVEFLKPIERKIITDLRNGKRVDSDDLVDFIRLESSRLKVDMKGFVFEASCYTGPKQVSLFSKILEGDLQICKYKRKPFNYFIHLDVCEEEMLNRAQSLLENPDPENFCLTNAKERQDLIDLKKKAEWMNSEEYEGEEEPLDPEEIKVLDENKLFKRINEDAGQLRKASKIYEENIRPLIEQESTRLHYTSRIKIDYATLDIKQSISTVKAQLGPRAFQLRPIAKLLEDTGEDNFTALSTHEIEPEQGDPLRRWSLFSTFDPVALLAGKVIRGSSDQAVEYAGRIFVFSSEENKNAFILNAKKYLEEKPTLPKNYNISITGLCKSGKSTIAKLLAEYYGYRVIEFGEYIEEKVKKQLLLEEPIPSNPYEGNVCLSKTELNDIMKGKFFDPRFALPLLLHENGIDLYERPPPLPEDQNDDLDDEEKEKRIQEEKKKREEELKKKKAAAAAAKKKKKAESGQPEEEEKKVLEIPLSELVPIPDQNGKTPELKGFIFIDFPCNEAQLASMKEMNIPLDRVVVLRENEEEGDGSEVVKREGFFRDAHLETEITTLTSTLEALKEGLAEQGDDIFREITIGSIEETFLKVRQFVDPFYVRVDDENNQLPVENGDDGETLPFGEFKNYCPVTLVDEGWLVLGSEEFEAQVRGRRYRFYNEENMQKFEKRLDKYLRERVILPEPRIFFTGSAGSGLKTQLALLHSRMKIPVLRFRDEFRDLYNSEKHSRMEKRRLEFKSKELEFVHPEEDSEEEYDPDEDSLLGQEDEEYERATNEIEITKRIFSGATTSLYDLKLDFPQPPKDIEFDFGNIDEDPEEGDEEKEEGEKEAKARIREDKRKEKRERIHQREAEDALVTIESDMKTLLTDTKRLPELFIIFRSKKKSMLERKFDKKRIIDQHARILEKLADMKAILKERFERKREQEIRKKEEEGEEIEDLAEFMPFDPEEVYSRVPEPPELNELLEAEKARLLEIWEDQSSRLDALKDEFEEIGIKVVVIKTDFEIERVFKKTKAAIKHTLEERDAILTAHMAVAIKDSETEDELTREKKVEKLLANYYYKESRFGKRNPLKPHQLNICLNFPLLFKNRIYYLSSEEERQAVMKAPLVLLKNEAAPLDAYLGPRIFFIGKFKSGKTSIINLLVQHFDTIVVRMKDVVELLLKNDRGGLGRKISKLMRNGNCISDELLVEALRLRLNFDDTRRKGFILDGFPKTKQQVFLLYKAGIAPDLVFSDPINDNEIRNRISKIDKGDFKFRPEILDTRLEKSRQHCKEMENIFQYNFGNLRYLNSKSNNAKLREICGELEKLISSVQSASIRFQEGRPFAANFFNIKKSTIMENISRTLVYSPVAFKRKGVFVQSSIGRDPLVFYKRKYYLLSSEEEQETFFSFPEQFADTHIDFEKMASIIPVAERSDCKYEIRGYCPVSVYLGKLELGLASIALRYQGKAYCFASPTNMRVFFKNPAVFKNVKIPEKLNIALKEGATERIKEKADLTSYLKNELSRLVVRSMNQLSWARIKYPTLSEKSTALKLMALVLKSSNPKRDDQYRDKYKKKLKLFITDCLLPTQIKEEKSRRGIILVDFRFRVKQRYAWLGRGRRGSLY